MSRSATILFAAAVACVPAAASAGTGQCYNRQGTPIGPTYDTDKPDYAYLKWVQDHGGKCVRVGSTAAPNYSTYQPAYPQHRPHYYPNGAPDFMTGPARPQGTDNQFSSPRANELIRQHYMGIGHATVSVSSEYRDVTIDGVGWRLFRVHWWPEHYEYVASRRNQNGMYLARKSFGGHGWSQVVRLGR